MDWCEKSSENESEPGVAIENGTNTPCFCDDLPEKQDKRNVSSCHKTSVELDAIGRQQSLSSTEKGRLLNRAHFISDKPFFKVIIQPSYAGVRSHMVISYIKLHNLLLTLRRRNIFACIRFIF